MESMKSMDQESLFHVDPADDSETVDYNRKEYPFYIRRGLLSTYPNYSAVSHWHEDLEFIVILSGHMSYNVNGVTLELPDGGGIFVNSRQFHHGFSTDDTECEFVCILFHPLLLCVNEFFQTTYVQPVISNGSHSYQLLSDKIPWQKETLDLLRGLYRQCSACGYVMNDAALRFAMQNRTLPVPKPPLSALHDTVSDDTALDDTALDDAALQIQQQIFRLWLPLYRNCPKLTKQAVRPNRQLAVVKQIVTFIRTRYKEPLTLSQIADAGNICKSSCCALFQKYLSRTPIAYLTEYRLGKSLELLFHTDLSITEISYEVGFNSASYFAETFKKYYQCTPTEYARVHRQP